MNYYRDDDSESIPNNIKRLDKNIDKIYMKMDNMIKDRENLLNIFDMRINSDFMKNILFQDINFGVDRYVDIFHEIDGKIGDYLYNFHLFITSKYHKIKMNFIIHNVSFNRVVTVNKYGYINLKQAFSFNIPTKFRFYMKSDKIVTVLRFSSFDVIYDSKKNDELILENKRQISLLKREIFELSRLIKINKENICNYVLEKIKKD